MNEQCKISRRCFVNMQVMLSKIKSQQLTLQQEKSLLHQMIRAPQLHTQMRYTLLELAVLSLSRT